MLDTRRTAGGGSPDGGAPYSGSALTGSELGFAWTGLPVRVEETGVPAIHLALLRLASRRYGLPIDDVLEFEDRAAVDPVSEGPSWLVGLVTRLDAVLPVVDLRRRLGLPRPVRGAGFSTVLAGRGEDAVGVVVDEAIGAVTIHASCIDPPTDLMREMQAVCAMARVGEGWIPVLDRGRLRRESDLALSDLGLVGARAASRPLPGAGIGCPR